MRHLSTITNRIYFQFSTNNTSTRVRKNKPKQPLGIVGNNKLTYPRRFITLLLTSYGDGYRDTEFVLLLLTVFDVMQSSCKLI